MNKTEAMTKSFKKRYVGIAVLAALALASGSISALVTRESVIKENQIIVNDSSKAGVQVSGKPIELHIRDGKVQDTNGKEIFKDKTYNWTMHMRNTGDTKASIKIDELPFSLRQKAGSTDEAVMRIVFHGIESGITKNMLIQDISDGATKPVIVQNDVTLDAGEQATLTIHAEFEQGVQSFEETETKFDMKFVYVFS